MATTFLLCGKSLQILKLDSAPSSRHTHATMQRSPFAVSTSTPLAAQLLLLGLFVMTLIVILPR